MQQNLLDPFREPEQPIPPRPTDSVVHSQRWSVTGHRFNRILEHTLADKTIAHVPVGRDHRQLSTSDYKLLVHNRLSRYVGMTLAEIQPRPSVMYIGMAEGFDCIVAINCILMKIPFIACLPFKGHAAEHGSLVPKAVDLVYTSPGSYKANWQYIKRDEYMISHGERCFAFWNGDESSGTGITVRFAEQQCKPIENCWQPWSTVVYKDTRPCPYPIQNSMSRKLQCTTPQSTSS